MADPVTLWKNSTVPDARPSIAWLREHGSLVAFERMVAELWLPNWLPLAPVFAQDRPNICTYADHGTVDQIATDALQSVGMYIVVDLEQAIKKSAVKQALVFNPFTFLITITEVPVQNRDAASGGTGMSCKQVADAVALAFEGLPIGNGCASLKGITFPSLGDDRQNAVVTLSTSYTVNLDHLYPLT